MREYDFSRLTVPLARCTRAYAAAMRGGRFKVYVVQDEAMTPSDIDVYTGQGVYDARDASIEVNKIIEAARLLAP